MKMLTIGRFERFIIRRVLILLCILVVPSLIFISHRFNVAGGLLIGSFFGLFKFSSLSSMITRQLTTNRADVIVKPLFGIIMSQATMILLFAVSIKYSLWLFAGVLVGVLLVPLAILINGVTEGLGVTHNHFE